MLGLLVFITGVDVKSQEIKYLEKTSIKKNLSLDEGRLWLRERTKEGI